MFEFLMDICTVTGILVWTVVLILAAAYSLGFVDIGVEKEAGVERD